MKLRNGLFVFLLASLLIIGSAYAQDDTTLSSPEMPSMVVSSSVDSGFRAVNEYPGEIRRGFV